MVGLKPPSPLCCLSAGGFDLTWGEISLERESSFADSGTCFYSRLCYWEGFPVFFKYYMSWNRNPDPKVKRLRFTGFFCIGINKTCCWAWLHLHWWPRRETLSCHLSQLSCLIFEFSSSYIIHTPMICQGFPTQPLAINLQELTGTWICLVLLTGRMCGCNADNMG